jgi:glycosyltransferase involved in cell wall biosynthesis
MRVGISLLTLVPGLTGGAETYARELVRALGRVGRHEYRVLLPSIATDVEGLATEVVNEYPASRSTPGRLFAMAGGWFVGRRLRERVDGLDLVHFPLTVTVPRLSEPPAITTVLDLQHEYLPQFFTRAERVYRSVIYTRSARRSSIVVTLSQFAADTIVDRLGLPAERVRPIHLGVDHELFRPRDASRRDFLLYPAREWPHKNHARLFAAFAALRQKRRGLELVLTAYDGPVPQGVRSLGRVSRAQLADLYRSAAAVVFPSLYEGFGQPPLEAMACGCPVACSNAASLPEVVGEAARLFDPTSLEEIVAAVDDVLDNRAVWQERGIERAAHFTWERNARQHDDVYDELAA